MRIVSMLPGATEIVCRLGLGDQLVGVSHDCDFPPEVRSRPRVTRSPFDAHSLPSAEIDRLVSETVAVGRELYHVDAEAIAGLEPDLVLTQGLCEVCAVSVRAVRSALSDGPRVLSLDAGSIEDVFADVRRVAEATGVPERGASTVARLRERLDAVRARVAGGPRRRIACLEWLDPPYRAGHWVPEMVEIAGGREVLARGGEPSARIRWEAVVRAEPEVLLLIPCGFGPERSLDEVRLLERLPGWEDLPAVRSGDVWAVDGNSYFSRPGPRLVDGVELAAALVHPDRFPLPAPSRARRAVGALSV